MNEFFNGESYLSSFSFLEMEFIFPRSIDRKKISTRPNLLIFHRVSSCCANVAPPRRKSVKRFLLPFSSSTWPVRNTQTYIYIYIYETSKRSFFFSNINYFQYFRSRSSDHASFFRSYIQIALFQPNPPIPVHSPLLPFFFFPFPVNRFEISPLFVTLLSQYRKSIDIFPSSFLSRSF